MNLPTPSQFLPLLWPEIQPYFDDLRACPLTPETIESWLADWSRLSELLHERRARPRVATVRDTTDPEAEAEFNDYLENIYPHMQKSNNALVQKLLDSGLTVPGMALALKRMRVAAELFRGSNLPLQAEEHKISLRFNKIAGAQTVAWEGEEYTITQLSPRYAASARATRRKMWQHVDAREQADRAAINALWTQVLDVRQQIAANADYAGDYRAYRWQLLNRFDYTPADCRTFHDAIEQVAVPAAGRVYEKHRRRLGVDTLRPWDLDLYQQTCPVATDGLTPFKDGAELAARGSAIFHKVDPALGEYFDTMRAEGLMDLENRVGKGPGAFCTTYEAIHRPFIFANAVGQARDVNTLLHEAGHAFHAFETFALPYYHQRWSSMEFAEVASTAMEFLGSPYLTRTHGGFYTPADAARARIKHLEKFILFWPYMAVVDAFQHWVYENPAQAADPANCDAAWAEHWARFIPSVDWSGLEDSKTLGWHRKRHIHRSPFYYIEYGLAQLGAVQIWENALQDEGAAVAAYRHALSLGGTVSTPELYAAAGGKFAFDTKTLQKAVNLIEHTLTDLETNLQS